MSIAEMQTLDTAAILMEAYDLGDLIISSVEVADYLYWKQQVENDETVRQAVRVFERKKELFEECERFGHFHPSYHEAMNGAYEAQEQLEQIEAVRRFKEAEGRLDNMFHTISQTIANAVSDSIKVPSNDPMPSGGCGSGGSCSGKCG